MCARTVNGFEQLYYWCSGTLIFLECSSMLNAAPVTNAFLSYTWLSKCFSSDVFFSYNLTTILLYTLFDNVLMKTYSLFGRRGGKKAFKYTKICGVIASEFCLFKGSFCWAKKWIKHIIFHFLFTLRISKKKKKKKIENVLELRQQICHWNVLMLFG